MAIKSRKHYHSLTFLLLAVICALVGNILLLILNDKINRKDDSEPKSSVIVDGRALLVDNNETGVYEPYFIKGVMYRPAIVGRHPFDRGTNPLEGGKTGNMFTHLEMIARDFDAIARMNANTVWIPKSNAVRRNRSSDSNVLRPEVLKLAAGFGLKVIVGFWIDSKEPYCGYGKTYQAPDYTNPEYRERIRREFTDMVERFKNFPAVLFWAIGNGGNAHINPNDSEQIQAYYSLLNEMALAAKRVEAPAPRPIAVVNFEIDLIDQLIYETKDEHLPGIDIWGIQAPRGLSFGNLFTKYAGKSSKPLWITSFGTDALATPTHSVPYLGREDETTQAKWVQFQWDEIVDARDVAIGGSIKEFADQWWAPDPDLFDGLHITTHDHSGTGLKDTDCDGQFDWSAPAPDQFDHAEWRGIMRVIPEEKTESKLDPRYVYFVVKDMFGCPAGQPYYAGMTTSKACEFSGRCCPKAHQYSYKDTCVDVCPVTD